jgi:hypothetical protein
MTKLARSYWLLAMFMVAPGLGLAEPPGGYGSMPPFMKEALEACQAEHESCMAREANTRLCNERTAACIALLEDMMRNRVLADVEQQDPQAAQQILAIEAQGQCVKGIMKCAEHAGMVDRNLAITQCVEAADTCSSDPARGCCPERCIRDFSNSVAQGEAVESVFLHVFVDAPEACFPGVPSGEELLRNADAARGAPVSSGER